MRRRWAGLALCVLLVAPSTARSADVPDVPGDVAAAMGRVSAEVRGLRSAARAGSSGGAAVAALLGAATVRAAPALPRYIARALATVPAGLAAPVADLARAVLAAQHTAESSPRAAATIAAAVERAAPALRAAAGSRAPRGTAAVERCDVIDLTPFLCVGGTANNIYSADQALLIDLGGDDRYNNTAGGAAPATALGTRPVSVNIDLDGDDTYDALIPSNREQPVQGAAIIGVGMLFDMAGDDLYRARIVDAGAPATGPALWSYRVQGTGALGGVGVLADLAGSDRYLLETTALAAGYAFAVQAQGMGIAGHGLLLDRGNDADTYEMLLGIAGVDGVRAGQRVAWGQGMAGLGGVGVLFDEGGDTSVGMHATTLAPPESWNYRDFPAPIVELVGQGVGITEGTRGALLTGDGASSYIVRAEGTGLTRQGIVGHGNGTAGGFGVLDDLDGDDRYELHNSLLAVADRVDGTTPFLPLTIQGQGFSYRGLGDPAGLSGAPAAGALIDHDGDDVYEAHRLGEVRAARTDGTPASAKALPAGGLLAQGVVTVGGNGLLVDLGGNDRYSARMLNLARADGPGALATADRILSSAQAQGAGAEPTAALVDLEGRDRYEALARSYADADGDGARAWEVGGWAAVQGSGAGGVLVDRDRGDADRFVSEPDLSDTCVGHRGEGPGWVECPPAPNAERTRSGGRGHVDSAHTKTPTVLTVETTRDPAWGATHAVGGILTEGGARVAGATVQVRLQWLTTVGAGEHVVIGIWSDIVAARAQTDALGTWTLPLPMPAGGVAGAKGYRVLAVYSGSEELRASKAPATVSPA